MRKKSCSSCEFNFGNVCAGNGKRKDNGESTYGMQMSKAKKMFPSGCDDWSLSMQAFTEIEEAKGKETRKIIEKLIQKEYGNKRLPFIFCTKDDSDKIRFGYSGLGTDMLSIIVSVIEDMVSEGCLDEEMIDFLNVWLEQRIKALKANKTKN